MQGEREGVLKIKKVELSASNDTVYSSEVVLFTTSFSTLKTSQIHMFSPDIKKYHSRTLSNKETELTSHSEFFLKT